MSIRKYLTGAFQERVSFTDDNLLWAMRTWGVTANLDDDIGEITERERDLVLAELYMLASSVVSGGVKRVQLGNRSITDGSYEHDRYNWIRLGNALFRKHDECDKVVWGARFEAWRE